MAYGNAVQTGISTANREAGGIDQHSTSIENNLQNVHLAVDELFKRLESALRPVQPTPAPSATSGPPLPVSSPLGERLRGHDIGIMGLRQRIAEILDRLDL